MFLAVLLKPDVKPKRGKIHMMLRDKITKWSDENPEITQDSKSTGSEIAIEGSVEENWESVEKIILEILYLLHKQGIFTRRPLAVFAGINKTVHGIKYVGIHLEYSGG
jgi:hypothetical protein